jgi:aconitate hydratase
MNVAGCGKGTSVGISWTCQRVTCLPGTLSRPMGGRHRILMVCPPSLRQYPGTEGGWTVHPPGGERMTIYGASLKYQAEKVPLIVIAGREHGSDSSRDWTDKGPMLLGVKAVIAQSYERIHRSNLIGMGNLPLRFSAGETPETLGLTAFESHTIDGIAEGRSSGKLLIVRARHDDGSECVLKVMTRIETPDAVAYYRHGGILPYVLRQLLTS